MASWKTSPLAVLLRRDLCPRLLLDPPWRRGGRQAEVKASWAPGGSRDSEIQGTVGSLQSRAFGFMLARLA